MLKVFKLRPVLKITLSALFIALTIVVSKFLPISNVFNLPFLRISLGPTLLIFASILLGPFYGALTGLLSDLVGFIFDTTGYAYNPLFSLTSVLTLSISLASAYKKPLVKGLKSSWNLSCPVAERVVSVLPWKLFFRVIIL